MQKRSTGLFLIALFKLAKAAMLILIGIGAFRLVHRDVEETAERFVEHFRADPDNRYLHAAIARLTSISPKKLQLLGIGTFAYAALFITEGIGLLLQKRWAEYLTVISTAGFIPLEIYEIARHPRPIRIAVLIINLAIVVYLVRELRRKITTQSSASNDG